VITRPGTGRGETFAELGQRLFGDRRFADEVIFMNSRVWTSMPKRSKDLPLPLGTRIVY
jgi:hypothetical protein